MDCKKYYSPYTLKISTPSYNLTDQYFDTITLSKEKFELTTTTLSLDCTKSTDSKFDALIKSNMRVKVIQESASVIVKLVKRPNFSALNKYLINKFGEGTCIIEFNFENGEETIIYEISDKVTCK